MIFYKLPKIAKKISILAGRIKNLIKLVESAILKKKYIIQILEAEDKIAELEKIRSEVSLSKGVKTHIPLTPKINNNLGNNHITPGQLAEDFETYLKFEEKNLLKLLERWGIKIILSELLDDCLSVLTDKGHIMLDVSGWEVVRSSNQRSFKSRFLDLAVEFLVLGWSLSDENA